MTLIAAMDCKDHILLGTDSLVTEETGLRVKRTKHWAVPGRPVVFGFSGDEGVGFQFRDWLLAYDWPRDLDWPTFGDVAATNLARLNGRRRALADLARAKVKKNDLASVLVAGFIGGVLDIWDLGCDGGSASAKHRGLVAIGSGLAHAFIAFATLTKWAGQTRNLNTMAVVMEVAVAHAPMCEEPIRLLKISKDGVSSFLRSPDAKWNEEPTAG